MGGCFACFGATAADPEHAARELEGRFEYARERLAAFGEGRLEMSDRANMAAFVKQALEGDCPALKPPLLASGETKAVFRAWLELRGMTRRQAIESYLRNFESVLKGKHEELRALCPENLTVANPGRFAIGGLPARELPPGSPFAHGPEPFSASGWFSVLGSGHSLEQRFQRSTEHFKSDPAWVFHCSMEDRLLLYGLMKQGGEGDVVGGRPGMLLSGPFAQEKYDAWAREKGVPRRIAQEKFCAHLDYVKVRAEQRMAAGAPAMDEQNGGKRGKHRRTASDSPKRMERSGSKTSSNGGSTIYWSPVYGEVTAA